MLNIHKLILVIVEMNDHFCISPGVLFLSFASSPFSTSTVLQFVTQVFALFFIWNVIEWMSVALCCSFGICEHNSDECRSYVRSNKSLFLASFLINRRRRRRHNNDFSYTTLNSIWGTVIMEHENSLPCCHFCTKLLQISYTLSFQCFICLM